MLTIDQAIRTCITSITVEKTKYLEAIKELLSHADINYRSNDDSQTTLLMLACNLNEYFLAELLMSTDYSNSIEKGDKRLNMNLKDSNNKNIFHHLLSLDKNFMTLYRAKSEYNAEINILNIFNYLTAYVEDDTTQKKKKKKSNSNPNFNLNFSEISEKDNDGFSAISLCLIKGYFKVAKQIISLGIIKQPVANVASSIEKFNVKANGFNLIHCAVAGKNINCLYLMLNYCVLSDLLHKSKENQTPAEYAKAHNLPYFHKVLKFYENNLNNPLTSKYLNSSDSFVNVNKLLTDAYSTEKYDEAMFLLEKLKLTNSLGDFSSYNSSFFNNNKDSTQDNYLSFYLSNDFSITWNHLMCQYNKIKKEPKDIKPETILSKFTSTDDKQKQNQNLYQKITNFFCNQISNITVENYKDNPNLLLLLFNKNIYFYKISNYAGCINTSLDILTHMKSCNVIEEYFSFFIFLNTSLILIDILFSHNLPFLASIFLERLEAYLSLKYYDKINEVIDEEVSIYLTQIEYLNNGTKTWDEIFSVINLVKAYRDLMSSYNELKTNDSNKYMKKYEELELNCKYKNNLPIFKSLQVYYECIKTKIFFQEGNYSKYSRILNDLYQKAINKDMKITINNSQFDMGISNAEELFIFYYNSQGILYLKQQKYQLSEFNFKKAISLFEKIALNADKKDYNFTLKLGTIHLLKFNLGLVYFYQCKYQQAKLIFSSLAKSSNSQLVNNLYLWYRLGASCFEIFRVKQSGLENKLEFDETKGDYLKFNTKMMDGNYKDGFMVRIRCILNFKQELSDEDYSLISEAVNAFKQILIIINQDIKGYLMLSGKSLYELFNIYSSKQYYTDDNELIPLINSNFKTKNYNSLIISTYLNLLFGLSLLQKWNEILFYAEDYQSSDYFNMGTSVYNNEVEAKVISYKVQSYINLNIYDKAFENINKLLSFENNEYSYSHNDFKSQFVLNNSTFIKEDNFRNSIQVSLIKYYYNKGDLEKGDRILCLFIDSLIKNDIAESDFPNYVINLIIYTLLNKNMHDKVLKIVKYRKVFEVLKELNIIKTRN